METDTSGRQEAVVEFPVQPTDTTELNDVQGDANDTARSEGNILQWMSYLPEDCIRAMIAMGWDITT
ncbi:MAG: hypothetical protein ACYDBZ_14255 [Steroidobacteraceae bacterium]